MRHFPEMFSFYRCLKIDKYLKAGEIGVTQGSVYSTNHQIFVSQFVYCWFGMLDINTPLYWHCDRFVCQGWKINDINFWRNSQRIGMSDVYMHAYEIISTQNVPHRPHLFKIINAMTNSHLSFMMRYRAISNRM